MATPTLEERLTGLFGQVAALNVAVMAIYHTIPEPQRQNVIKRFDYLSELVTAQLLNQETSDEFVEQTRRFLGLLKETLGNTRLETEQKSAII